MTRTDVRFLPKLIAEIFGGTYYVVMHPDQTCTVLLWTGREWHAMRRR